MIHTIKRPKMLLNTRFTTKHKIQHIIYRNLILNLNYNLLNFKKEYKQFCNEIQELRISLSNLHINYHNFVKANEYKNLLNSQKFDIQLNKENVSKETITQALTVIKTRYSSKYW